MEMRGRALATSCTSTLPFRSRHRRRSIRCSCYSKRKSPFSVLNHYERGRGAGNSENRGRCLTGKPVDCDDRRHLALRVRWIAAEDIAAVLWSADYLCIQRICRSFQETRQQMADRDADRICTCALTTGGARVGSPSCRKKEMPSWTRSSNNAWMTPSRDIVA